VVVLFLFFSSSFTPTLLSVAVAAVFRCAVINKSETVSRSPIGKKVCVYMTIFGSVMSIYGDNHNTLVTFTIKEKEYLLTTNKLAN